VAVADNAVVLLNALLEERDRLRGGAPLRGDEAFELFSFEQCLKHQDLSEEEIAGGQVGGGNDGGIDGLYCFLNGNLIEEDAEVLDETFDPSSIKREPELHLVIVQAKRSASFAETPFDKLAAALRDLLDLSKTEEDLAELFSPSLVERFEIFRRTWQKLATRHPRIRVTVVYASKGDSTNINDKVKAKAERLRDQIAANIPKADAEVVFLGARELVDLAGQEKSYTLQLNVQENATAENSHIVLVPLDDYFAFITDESGALQKHIFDWNVRDYEGAVEVNQEISRALGDADAPEFWWLNNGVTIICSRASATGKTFSLDDVQVVNGLQTSVTIFEYLRRADTADPARSRSLLVRIIVTDDHDTRDRVIRATNRQTAVPVASLRATDDIQRDLERFFVGQDWFYERRKNYYRNQGKTPSKIVSIPYLAQAIMAIGLSDPSNSRARPSSLLKRDVDYERIFDARVEYPIYLWVAQVQKAVDEFLRSERAAASATDRTNLRFHVSMLLVARRLGARVYNAKQLAALVGTEFTEDDMMSALQGVREALADFQKGQVDKIVKGRDFTDALLGKEFPPAEEAA
jgi:hypothetical protein